ncbi:unnamed protein product [Dicrocoelium dendriticum]|nr:unnamed protein product [Dicrocoelium dendriticum]
MSEGFKGSIDLIHLKRRRKKQILKAFNSTHPVRAEYEFVIRDLGMTYTMDANRFVGSPEAVMTAAKKCATIVDVSSMVTESTIVDNFPPQAVREPTAAPSKLFDALCSEYIRWFVMYSYQRNHLQFP